MLLREENKKKKRKWASPLVNLLSSFREAIGKSFYKLTYGETHFLFLLEVVLEECIQRGPKLRVWEAAYEHRGDIR